MPRRLAPGAGGCALGGEPGAVSRYRCAKPAGGVNPGGVFGQVWQEVGVIRGFFAGVGVGAVLAGLGLGALSLSFPLGAPPLVQEVPGQPAPEGAPAAPDVAAQDAVAVPEPDEDAVADTAAVPDTTPDDPAQQAAEGADPAPAPDRGDSSEAAQASGSAEPDAAGSDPAPVPLLVPSAPVIAGGGQQAPLVPAPSQAETVVQPPADMAVADTDPGVSPGAAPESPAVPQTAAPDPMADPAPVPSPPEMTAIDPAAPEGQPPAAVEAPAAPDAGPGIVGLPVVPDPQPLPEAGTAPGAGPEIPPEAAPVRPLPGLPSPGLAGEVAGVRTGRLPSIGAPPTALETMQDDALVVIEEPGADADLPALVRNARAFANPGARPPMVVILVDTGDTAVDMEALATGGLAVTLAVDPARPGAAERAAAWRAAGQEVAVLSSVLPQGSQTTDHEVAMEAISAQVPGALAILDLPSIGLQGDGGRAGAAIPALAARGFGLVTWERGVNPADQRARRAGLPSAQVFRDIDAEGEAAPVVRRYLDRAVFKAQQDGQVVVVGRLRPETVEGLLDWARSGRIGDVAPAPLSAVLVPN